MSLIAFNVGMLVADRVAEKAIWDTSYYKEMKKLHVSPTRMFAFAYCGEELLNRHLSTLHDVLLTTLTLHAMEESQDTIKMPESIVHLMKPRSMIIVTHDRVYHKLEVEFSEIEMDDWCANSTYVPAFRAALAYGLDTIKAAKTSVKFASGRDSIIDSVSCSKLRPMVKVKS